MVHPQVNGVWVKQDELHGGNVFYKHSTETIFIYAQENNGNWVIGAAVKGPKDETRFYFARPNNGNLPMEKGRFIVAYSFPHEPSQLVITYGGSIGKITNCVQIRPHLIASYLLG